MAISIGLCMRAGSSPRGDGYEDAPCCEASALYRWSIFGREHACLIEVDIVSPPAAALRYVTDAYLHDGRRPGRSFLRMPGSEHLILVSKKRSYSRRQDESQDE